MSPEVLQTSPITDFDGKAGKKGLIIAIAVILFVAAAGVIIYFVLKGKKSEAPTTLTQEEIIKGQLAELDRLRGETAPLTQEQIDQQLKELDKLRGKTKPLTQEEINKQLEELDRLRTQQ